MEEIFEDLFNIVRKIKEIDSNYRVFRNKTKHRFEVYYQKGLRRNLELVVPFDFLDYRLINLINKSKIENADLLFKEMDEQNRKRGLIWN